MILAGLRDERTRVRSVTKKMLKRMDKVKPALKEALRDVQSR